MAIARRVKASPRTATRPIASTSRSRRTKGSSDFQAVFSEVSGLQVEMQTTDYEEGRRRTTDVHKLPRPAEGQQRHPQAWLVKSNEFLTWCMRAALEKPIGSAQCVDRAVRPVRPKRVMRWNFLNAFPVQVGWPAVHELIARPLAIESVELAHEGMTVETS